MLIVLSLNVIVFIAIAVALFWKYRLTRDAGFLWFSAAIVVWPLVSAGLRSLAKGPPPAVSPPGGAARAGPSPVSRFAALAALSQLVKSEMNLSEVCRSPSPSLTRSTVALAISRDQAASSSVRPPSFRTSSLSNRMRAWVFLYAAALPGQRHALFSIAHNALTNAFLHARAGRVEVPLDFGDDSIRLSVSDDGVGLPDGYAERGRGFRGMRADAERLGGRLIVETGGPGGGTTVTCEAPY